MLTFIASRISSGNTLFPDKIEIDAINVTYYKGYLTGYQSTIISRKNIASVHIGSGLLFADVIIETIGGKRVTASGYKKTDAKSIVAYLSFSDKGKGDINQNVYVNTVKPILGNRLTEETIQSPLKMSAEKEILLLGDKMGSLSLKEIMINTNLEINEIENALKLLIDRNLTKIEIGPSGENTYRFTKDWYGVLGINKNASKNEIKMAYRNIAIKNHPDKNHGNTEAEKVFKEASEAYENIMKHR